MTGSTCTIKYLSHQFYETNKFSVIAIRRSVSANWIIKSYSDLPSNVVSVLRLIINRYPYTVDYGGNKTSTGEVWARFGTHPSRHLNDNIGKTCIKEKKNLVQRREREARYRKRNLMSFCIIITLWNIFSTLILRVPNFYDIVRRFGLANWYTFSHVRKMAYLNQTEEARIIFINCLRRNKPPHENQVLFFAEQEKKKCGNEFCNRQLEWVRCKEMN